MTYQENNDPLQLGQLIRFNAHMLQIATRTKNPDLEKKKKEAEELERYLGQWDNAGFQETPYIIWARNSLDTFKKWLKDPQFSVARLPERGSINPDQDLRSVIRGRRSIRFWQKKKVPHNLINEILEAGIYAPSAFNRLPWRFFVAETALKDLQEGDASNPGMFQQAPVRIFVAVDERLFFEKYSGALDAGLAMQNMLLTAHALGLGTCLIYQGEFVDKKILEEYYQIPSCCIVYCAILLGYPDENPAPPARMRVEEITRFLGEIPNPDF